MIAAPTINGLVTEDDLTRARSDPEFRQQLLSRYLEQLLEELSVRRKERDSDSPEAARQIRKGSPSRSSSQDGCNEAISARGRPKNGFFALRITFSENRSANSDQHREKLFGAMRASLPFREKSL